jgi:ADP-heptose:LPS heptosyltransferase
MKNFICLQSMGDNLISLYLLSQINHEVTILGTQQTKKISQLINTNSKLNVVVVFEKIPAFYDIRKQGIISALKDILKFRSYLKKHNIKHLVFEKKDIRTTLLTFGIARYDASDITKQVYINRKNLIEKCLCTTLNLKETLSPKPNTLKTVLIAPSSQAKNRNIQKIHLDIILKLLQHKYKIYLLDYDKSYKSYLPKVDKYYTNLKLDEVKALIINCDLLIGTDSFLVHLSYFYEKPFFTVFNYEYFDFLPPKSEIINNYIITNCDVDMTTKFLDRFQALKILP